MKALSIREPWATLIRDGKKTIETRTWSTKYRGKLLLVASKQPNSPIAGQAFAICTLTDCRPMTKEDEPAAACETYPKAHSWILRDVTPIKPFPVRGQLSLYEVTLP